MTQNEIQNNDEIEINLSELFQFIKSKYKSIILTTLIFALVAGLVTSFLISPKYESSAQLYLNSDTKEDGSGLDYTQINSNKAMINTYVGILQGNNIQTQVANKLYLESSIVKNSVSVSNIKDTLIIVITAKTDDPVLSRDIVETTVEVFTEEASNVLSVNNIVTIDKPMIPEGPVSPSLPKNVVIGALLGSFLSIGIYFIKFLADTRIHTKEDAEKYLGIPSLGSIPLFEE